MSMESLYHKLAATVTGFLALLGIGGQAEGPVALTPEVQTAIHEAVSNEVQDAMTLYVAEAKEGPIFGTSLPIAGSAYTLAGAGVSNSATSITLSSLTVTQNGYEIVDADLSPTFYITLEPGNKTKQEIVSCTTVTQNANDTATLSGCTRGLSPVSPYTSDSTLKFSHGGGTQVIFSNPPQFYNEFANLGDDETVTGQWTFSTFPITPSNSAASETVSGVSELATQAEAALGTSAGGTGGRLTLPASIATSTYNTASLAASRVIVSSSTGQIDSGFLQYATPIASITAYASSTAPAGWLLADGSAVSRTTYSKLFAAIGTIYGAGNGATTFNLPDLRGRAVVMASSTQTALLGLNRSTLGSTGSTTSHTLTEAQLPAHTHSTPTAVGTGPNQGSGAGVAVGSSGTSGSTGSNAPFNILDPYIILYYIIKY